MGNSTGCCPVPAVTGRVVRGCPSERSTGRVAWAGVEAVVSHETALEVHRIRVTTPLRTPVDVAAVGVDGDQLDRAIEEARDLGVLTPRQLRERAEAVDIKAALRIEQALGRLGL